MTDGISTPPASGTSIPLDITVPANLISDGVTGAYCCGTINQFVLIGNYQDSSAWLRNTLRWCAIGDVTSWPTPDTAAARAVQAGAETLDSKHGWITGITGNDFFGYVFQERAVTKVTYVGGDVVFTFDTFEEDRGLIRPGRKVQVDDAVFFESSRGFHVLQNDVITDIGYGKVDDTYA